MEQRSSSLSSPTPAEELLMSTRPEITSPTEFLGTTVEELESRLATNALYDEDNKRLLEELLTENEELRKGNMTLEMENRRL